MAGNSTEPGQSVTSRIAAISAGALHNLALLTDGTVAGWGWNAYGQLDIPPNGMRGGHPGGLLGLLRDGLVSAVGHDADRARGGLSAAG